ncbi:MAG: sugar transferase [Verrucomicrobia bacterium]|nr:sugar transferase [Verrucomicrobiota bacterium]
MSRADGDPLPRWKRLVDLICCVLAFPFLVLLTVLVGLVMKLLSPGVIFFRQERVGLNGRRFKIYKFRTMQVGADTSGHQQHFARLMRSHVPMQKLDARGDARLIPGAWILRTTGLDELPQIVNVWRGEMSIVGPRPCIPYEYEQYTAEQRERCRSVPGLTGLWQVSGKNRTTFDEMIRLDRAYGDRRSLGLDLWIIVRTIPALCIQYVDVTRARRAARQAALAAIPEQTVPDALPGALLRSDPSP